MNTFDRINQGIHNSEASLVNLLSAIAPWAAPLAPAYMSFSHMTGSMAFPNYIAWSIALVVEVLGLSAISTIIGFWSHNRKYKSEQRRAPVWVAVFSFLFYLAVIIMVNVMLDYSKLPGVPFDEGRVIVAARAMLTLLSVPAAILLAVRTQYKELLDTIERERVERKGVARSESVGTPALSGGGRKAFISDYNNGKLEQRLKGDFTAENIAAVYGVDVRTAYRWRARMGETRE